MSAFVVGTHEDATFWEDAGETREDAELTGREVFDGDGFYSGVKTTVSASYYLRLDVSNLFDQMADTITDNEGEYAETYAAKFRELADTGHALARDLEARLRAAFDEWATAHLMQPDFYVVHDTQFHPATTPPEDPHE